LELAGYLKKLPPLYFGETVLAGGWSQVRYKFKGRKGQNLEAAVASSGSFDCVCRKSAPNSAQDDRFVMIEEKYYGLQFTEAALWAASMG
jgi:hypothetical protein